MMSITKMNLLIWDSLFISGFIMLFYATDFFEKANITIVFLIGFALFACVRRHINYNRQHIN